MPGSAVSLQGIAKRFPGVVANQDVSLEVRSGTVHAVVGENGAGKSTLMKILYGVQRPDEGTITVRGEQVSFSSPTDAIAHGIGMVFQHFQLADNLTVVENVVLGAERLHGIGDKASAEIDRISTTYGFALDPDALVETLGVGERQRVEILKVLYRGARIIILDEPTAVLVPQEVEALFANLRELQREDHTLLFISHKLDEVLAIADEITVLRRGATVGTVRPADVTQHDLAELMVGAELPDPGGGQSTVTDRLVLEVRDLRVDDPDGRHLLSDVSLSIRAGEVVGVAGVEGNGQTELVEAVVGLRRAAAGGIALG
ncbi:MAG: ATP-binding cassette domain-containing protein, partial [Actinomycetota bacterium]|nr:ATP-binding cassette domain-containing protein [Actinomycetota bacterium]